jgi:RNA polymerase sigma-70 factor (ECF subfamily)
VGCYIGDDRPTGHLKRCKPVLEDRLLVWRLRRGSSDSFCRIYDKYRDDLLRLAVSLLNEAGLAEDVVHDVFTSFIRGAKEFELRGSLRAYLAKCVANRARNANRAYHRRQNIRSHEVSSTAPESKRPDQRIRCSEELKQLGNALAQLPYSQREAITLHLQGEMKFREIAEFQGAPIKTVQSRYRMGIERLRSLLNSEVAQ